MTSGERNAIVRKGPVLEMREGARAPQRASAHPSHAGVSFSKPRPPRWHTTPSASEGSSPRGRWWCNSRSNTGVAGPRRTSWHPPADCVCTRLSPIVPGPVTRSWIREHLSRKGLSPQKEDNDRDCCQPSSRWQLLKTCQCLSGEMQGKIIHQTAYLKTYVEQCQEYHSSAFNHNLGFEIQTSPRSSLPAPWLSFQAVLQQCRILSQVLAAHSILSTNHRELQVPAGSFWPHSAQPRPGRVMWSALCPPAWTTSFPCCWAPHLILPYTWDVAVFRI